ncbi:helix-turn-helix domain-containing protein [Jatrophihabitans sp.]|uniref:MarR family transcriptional regulator n=1 Tax=Jatrophihabitans sp. TaxID=1932789 RepID=UPI0030C6E6BF
MEIDDLVFLGQQLVRLGRVATHEGRPDLQAAESMVVGHLLERRFSSITELATSTGYAQSRISKAVSVLKERGLVATRSDPADGRRSVVYLVDTAAGEAGRAAGITGDDVLQELLRDHPETERKEIIDALTAVLLAIRAQRPAAGGTSQLVVRKWADELGVEPGRLNSMNPGQLLELMDKHRATVAPEAPS